MNEPDSWAGFRLDAEALRSGVVHACWAFHWHGGRLLFTERPGRTSTVCPQVRIRLATAGAQSSIGAGRN